MQNTEVSADGFRAHTFLLCTCRLAAGLSFPAKYHQSDPCLCSGAPVTPGRLRGMGGGEKGVVFPGSSFLPPATEEVTTEGSNFTS